MIPRSNYLGVEILRSIILILMNIIIFKVTRVTCLPLCMCHLLPAVQAVYVIVVQFAVRVYTLHTYCFTR